MAGPIDLLCLQCGLCCNGVLFADVRPERGDDSRLFQQYGLRVPQPCPAFNAGDCKCAVYSDRPQRCRKFECKQLIAVQAGQKASAAALTKIRGQRSWCGQLRDCWTPWDSMTRACRSINDS